MLEIKCLDLNFSYYFKQDIKTISFRKKKDMVSYIRIKLTEFQRKSMRLRNVLIVVKDMKKSIKFYKELFGLSVILDQGGNVILTEGLVLQDAVIWKDFLKKDIIWENHATELYFEENDMDAFVKKLEAYPEPIQYVNTLMEHSWGQKVVRFYDPDGNLIEVGTPM